MWTEGGAAWWPDLKLCSSGAVWWPNLELCNGGAARWPNLELRNNGNSKIFPIKEEKFWHKILKTKQKNWALFCLGPKGPHRCSREVGTFSRRLCLKPAHVQDTEYMVEKTYQLTPYVAAFGAYLEPQWPIYGSKGVSIYQKDRWNVAVNTGYLPSGQQKN